MLLARVQLGFRSRASCARAHSIFERNRHLFYVSCSRSTTRLALLLTHLPFSNTALQTLQAWFAAQNPHFYQRDVENIVNAILGEVTNAMLAAIEQT